ANGNGTPPPPPATKPVRPPPLPPSAKVVAPPPPPRPYRPALVGRGPVGWGQVIRAEKSDLVIMAPVNPGGQVVADGHVHIYSTLRGRAIAGAGGCPDARIFCHKMEAELVAINGLYVMADE